MKIQFLGAAKEVTGSKHMFITNNGTKILLDCGMFQGKGLETDGMNRNLGFNPVEIDYLILSHAHIDHSGLIPYIYKLGFRGTIICTHGTRDLCSIMLADAGKIQEADTYTFNKKRALQGLPPVEPIYTFEDAQASMECFISIPYKKKHKITPEVAVTFTNSGHIMGASAVNLEFTENGKTTRVCFTGDIGRYENLILKNPEDFPQADYILLESTYGDRLHPDRENTEQLLLQAVLDTCTKRKGKLIIPAFSIGRTQEIVYTLQLLERKGLLPSIDVFVDSPLSVSATNIMRLHTECFNDELLHSLTTDPDPFGFEKLHYIQKKEDSKKLNERHEPCIIISASGMMEAGRVKHHLFNNIEDKKNTILGVGYCSPVTLGAKILRGDKHVSIFGHLKTVRAEIRQIESFSAHADYKEMLKYISCQNKKEVKKIFLIHGEEGVQERFSSYLNENGFENVYIPQRFETVEIN